MRRRRAAVEPVDHHAETEAPRDRHEGRRRKPQPALLRPTLVKERDLVHDEADLGDQGERKGEREGPERQAA